MKKFLFIFIIIFCIPTIFISSGCTPSLNDSGDIITPSNNNSETFPNNENNTNDSDSNEEQNPPSQDPTENPTETPSETPPEQNEEDKTEDSLTEFIEWKDLIFTALVQYSYLSSTDNISLTYYNNELLIQATRTFNFSLEDIGMINFLLNQTLSDFPYDYDIEINKNIINITIKK